MNYAFRSAAGKTKTHTHTCTQAVFDLNKNKLRNKLFFGECDLRDVNFNWSRSASVAGKTDRRSARRVTKETQQQ